MRTQTNALKPRDGILVLSGYGLRVSVERRYLIVEDGVGRERRTGALHHATSGLKALAVIGHSGFVTFEALRWLSDAGAAFTQLDSDGKLIASFTRGANDVGRRRAQLAAATNESGIVAVRGLLAKKLRGQRATLVRFQPGRLDVLTVIEDAIEQLADKSLEEMRWQEAVAASAYWTALAPLTVNFPRREQDHLPDHWGTIGPRTSPVSGKTRLAVTPFHAMLNYLYAILEVEARIASSVAGFDPEAGLLHAERRSRNSFAHDVMEPLRPVVDAYLLDLLAARTLSVRDFNEMRDGHCRLTPDLARMLAQTGPRWTSRLEALLAFVGKTIERPAEGQRNSVDRRVTTAAARTGRLHRITTAQGRSAAPVLPKTVCVECGGALARGLLYCRVCKGRQQRDSVMAARPAAVATVAALRADGRDPTHGGAARQRRGMSAASQEAAVQAAGGRTQDAAAMRTRFDRELRGGLEVVSVQRLCDATGLSPSYWSLIRRGMRVPHVRHWEALRRLSDSADPTLLTPLT